MSQSVQQTPLTNGGNGGASSVSWSYTATNYNDLVNNVAPTALEGELAIVYNSQGVWLINRKLKGIYIYQSGSWQYANQELQDNIQANSGDMLKSVYDPNTVEDDAFNYANFLGTWQVKGNSTTINLTSNVDDLDVDGFNIVNLTSDQDNREITGIKAPPSGVNRLIVLINNNSAFRIKIVGNSGSSLSDNRFVLRANTGSRNLEDYQMTFCFYNHNLNKWHITRIA